MARRPPIACGLAAAAACLALAAPAGAGTLSVLTYNVAGLPEGISGSHPAVNTIQISPLLNPFDLVVVQEDFFYHTELVTHVTHPYLSPPDPMDDSIGDGLNTLSRSPFAPASLTRITWNDCFGIVTNGADCLTTKGFSFARHEIEPGVFLDVYDWHADAGRDPGSNAARQGNLRQLYAYIQQNSAGNAVLVAGDTNSRYTDQFDILPEMLAAASLGDVWIELVRGGSVPALGAALQSCAPATGPDCEVVDKILYRSSADLVLTPTAYHVYDDVFLDANGAPLSDHFPVWALFDYQVPEPGAAPLLAAALWLGARRARRLRASIGTLSHPRRSPPCAKP